MKQSNFPGARNFRRKEALHRRLAQKRDAIINIPAWEKEVAALKASIVSQESALAKRSKIFRGSR